jgi:hypothetical protein
MGDYAKRCVVEMVRRVSRTFLQTRREVWAQDLILNIQSASNFKRPNDNGVKRAILLSSYHEHSFNKPCRRLVPPSHKADLSLPAAGRTAIISASLGWAADLPGVRLARCAFGIERVCINQEDDEERNGQVGLMRDIYACAKRVLVWLGECTPVSDTAFDVLAHLNPSKFENEAIVYDVLQLREFRELAQAVITSMFFNPW